MLKILMFSSNTYLAGQTWRRIRPDRAQCRTQVRLRCSQGRRCYEYLPPNSSCDIPASAGQRSAPPWINKLKWSPIGTRATRGDSSEYRSNFRLADYVDHNMIWKHCASVYVRNRKATRMVRPCYEEGTHGRVLGAEVPGEAMLWGGNTRTSAGCGSTRRGHVMRREHTDECWVRKYQERPCYEEGTHGRVLGAEVPGERAV